MWQEYVSMGWPCWGAVDTLKSQRRHHPKLQPVSILRSSGTVRILNYIKEFRFIN